MLYLRINRKDILFIELYVLKRAMSYIIMSGLKGDETCIFNN